MSQIIVTSRYLKSGTAKTKYQRKNYTKYIATRESVEVREQNKKYSMENQKNLLNELLNDFPEAKKYLEYEDYKNNPTVQNASELITTIIERHADVIGNRQNFVGYMAMRPGVEKRGSHGLFNEKDEPIVLDRVAEEAASHPGNVWSHVVSLRREDAIRLGYDNSERWRELVMRHIADIAEQTKIPLCNLKWYGSFHDTTHHPHIHLIVYSTNTKKGFLTKQGIDKIRSVFANDIFHDDLQSIYQEQTLSRDELKTVSKTEFENIIQNFQQSDFDNPQLENLIRKLHLQLQTVKGKKVYGYLSPYIKETVNNIFSELAKDDNIRQLYEKWCGLERLKYKTYTQKEKELPQLVDNKVFQPVRNMIIKAVLDMNNPAADIEVNSHEPTEPIADTNDNLTVEQPPQLDKSEQSADDIDYVQGSAELGNRNAKCILALKYISGKHIEQNIEKGITMLTECADSGDAFSCYRLGNLFLQGKIVMKDLDKAEKYLLSAKDNEFTQHALGKLYLQKEKSDIMKAISYFKKSADKNMWSSYQLGKLYLFGADGLEKDQEKAIQLLNLSVEQGNEYAQNFLDNTEKFENEMLADTIFSLFANLSRCIEDDYHNKFQSGRKMIDSKLQKIINQKKESLGIKEDFSQSLN